MFVSRINSFCQCDRVYLTPRVAFASTSTVVVLARCFLSSLIFILLVLLFSVLLHSGVCFPFNLFCFMFATADIAYHVGASLLEVWSQGTVIWLFCFYACY